MTVKEETAALPPYSVLITVYDKELPENLNDSLESMLMQSYPPTELILVCDGRLTCELNIIAKSFESEYKKMLKVIRIDEHVGAAAAINEGIKECTCPFIVRMDSDDVSYPDRCLKQMKLFAERPDLDMVGTFAEVYDITEGKTVGVKHMPTSNKKIKRYARRRNPFCRQTLAFRRELAIEVGGYAELEECEDYEFAVRMLSAGAKARNIPEALVRYRVSEEDYRKRKSWKATKNFIAVRKLNRRNGSCSMLDVMIPSAVQLGLCVLPWRVTKKFYCRMRKNGEKHTKSAKAQ
ncbi:MAG: glycosyltransferase [Ruminococcus sp.]|nr:glycosyltransferase [Ruminococcus sp.]MBR1394018.1 glycosyltransferase [Ruminococcus sp.]